MFQIPESGTPPGWDANRATLIHFGEGVKCDKTSVKRNKSRGFVTGVTPLAARPF
jgi:hypothetical protein